MERLFFTLASVSGGLAVALGAFGAHSLRARLTADLLATFETGVRWLRRLGDTLYAPDFDLNQFLHDHPQLRGDLTDLLMGRIFEDRAARLIEALDGARK